ncbi:hypothetical protein M758_7G095200 [Ceratodon purpureus]|nr:hypothetical protein M758_7G095200 [Ceratodon purpureus]
MRSFVMSFVKSSDVFFMLVMLFLMSCSASGSFVNGRQVFNVMMEGAVGDGRTDDGEVFQRVWAMVCRTPSAIMYVPAEGRFSLPPSVFGGPCAPNLLLQVEGTIVALEGPESGTGHHKSWLVFRNLRDFSVVGNGRINGKGNRWWSQVCRPSMKNCGPDSRPEEPPNGLVFQNSSNIRVSNLRIRDSPKFHLTFSNCDGVYATGLHITAPRDSPNTDGIHLTNSRNVFILNCKIRTGDDCVSIQSGSNRVLIEDIMCGPGHGISVGSLGESKSRACVWGIRVERAIFDRTTNGFRIKTWQGGSGHAHGMRFVNSRMNRVHNPVVIDQYYCDSPTPCTNQTSAVAISEIIIANITGTSSSNSAVKIKCSDHVPCRNIVLQNIAVRTGPDQDLSNAHFSCWNAYGFISNITNPMSCALLPQPPLDTGLVDSSKPYQIPQGC